VLFEESASEEDQLAAMNDLCKDRAKHNMWVGMAKKIATNQWHINYGYDSGD
jgi:hypothetical protein